ncbi:MAG TPA: TraB/GumN family protein [Acidiferrobacteraceae bacterium]|nr:TraB/GumN family protein [Acidiferrobacteraceae bacterium]HEX20369.1 TraB/GumN family protein [Acidiferrobacteraceae bacterium]
MTTNILLRRNKNTFVLYLLVFLLFSLFAFSANAGKFSKGILWKIDGKYKKPSYLLGTMHSEDHRVINFPPVIRDTFSRCDSLSLELVPDFLNITKTATSVMYSDGRSLDKVVDRETYRRSVKALVAYGIPEMAASLMKPWAVMLTLSMPKPKTGMYMDIKLYRMALAEKKKVYGLETVEEQVQIFESMPLEKQIVLLKETLDNLVMLPSIIEEMTLVYLQRDLQGLVLLSKKYAPKDKVLAELLMIRLLEKRNKIMFQRMQPRLRAGNACIAVGALHLPGKTGLLQTLEHAGFKVSSVY